MARPVDLAGLIEAFLSQKFRAVTISQRVVISPWVVDAQIVQATDASAQWYGFAQPADLVGHWQSCLQHPQDVQLSREMAMRRHVGYTEIPTEYVSRIRQGNRERFWPVRKQTTQLDVDGETYWITVLETPRGPLLADTLDLTAFPLPDSDEVRQFGSTSISVREMEALLHDVFTAPTNASHPLPVLAAPGPTPRRRRGGLWRMLTRPTASQMAHALGQLLRQTREAQGLTQHEVAERCTQLLGRQLTPKHLSNLELGHRLPSLLLLQGLATILALDAVALVATVLRPMRSPSPDIAIGRPMDQVPHDVLTHVQQAAQQIALAQQAYRVALLAAQQAGYSLRQLAAVTGLSPSRIRQLVNTVPHAPAPPTPPV
jgi:transcriptional regulator with XRE-family HTH domain